jgi:antitoxin (DNA-binding transcriptional repressor) of toxin-antitoxin stability system
MYVFGIEEAAEKLDWLIDLAQQGEEVHVYLNGKPCVRVIAVSA